MEAVARDIALIVFYLIMIGVLFKILALVRKQNAKMHELEKQMKTLERIKEEEKEE